MIKSTTQAAMDLSKFLVGWADRTTNATLDGVRNLIGNSLEWSSDQLQGLAKLPLIDNSSFSNFLHDSGQGLLEAGTNTRDALVNALNATGGAMQTALDALNIADNAVNKTLFENLHVASVVGESFGGVITTSEIRPSFRLNGEDVGAQVIIDDWRASGLANWMLCVPGLFCDESLWSTTGDPSLEDTMREHGFYPIMVRFNPGSHISTNGRALLQLMNEFIELTGNEKAQLYAITYSQGGLIFRSAMYYGKESRSPLTKRVGHALLINSPDGGSYLEKLGFWLGLGLQMAPAILLKLAGFVGNQRSDAIQDLSHGIIREEDWRTADQVGRYSQEIYFGELDDIMATQIMSLVSEDDNPWVSWIGDGIVEKPSLYALTDRVYRNKSNPKNRVHCIYQTSHFQVLAAPETNKVLRSILA